MNVSSFNNEEVVQLLLNALKISNDKCQVLSDTVKKQQEKIQENALAKTKVVLEKDNAIESLNAKIDALNTKLNEAKESYQTLEEDSQKAKQNLEDIHRDAIQNLKSLQEEELKAKDSKISEIETELELVRSQSSDKDNTISRLQEDVSKAQQEFECFKVETIYNLIQKYLCELKNEGGLLNADELCGLKQYIESIESSTITSPQNYDTVESLCRALLSPDGLMSTVCNLIWWLNNDSIKDAYSESIEIFKKIVDVSSQIINTLTNFGYVITMPSPKFRSDIPNYTLYDNDTPHVTDIFPKVSFEKYVLCEIYTVSYNDNKGKCYSL